MIIDKEIGQDKCLTDTLTDNASTVYWGGFVSTYLRSIFIINTI